MKRGDTVVCVDNAGVEHRLTEGETYKILQTPGDFVSVIGDNNEVYSFTRYRFLIVQPPKTGKDKKHG